MTFNAADYSFSGPDTVPAGWTSIRLVNQGQEPHHLTLLKLAEGRTVADFMNAMQSDAPPPPGLFTEEGGPNGITPGTDAIAVVNLEPGTYILACFVPSPDGAPHIAKGMMKPLTVTPAPTGAGAGEPRATITIDGFDFGFRVTPEVTAGNQMFRFNNTGAQHHEVQVVRVAPGRTLSDVMAFFESDTPPSGPPPAEFLGGISGIEAGEHAYFPVQVTPGTYGLFCFVPDVTDPQGTSHIAKGMVSEFTVR